jgi:hypothetical protein
MYIYINIYIVHVYYRPEINIQYVHGMDITACLWSLYWLIERHHQNLYGLFWRD